MTQDALDDFFIRAELKQVRCNTASARMAAVPFQPNCLQCWTDDLSTQVVQVARRPI
jgi:hypothetical protein